MSKRAIGGLETDAQRLLAGELPRRDRVQIALAWVGWCVLALAMAVIVFNEPVARSVTGNYRGASDLFWAGQPMYTPGRHGWIYLPNSALLYSPFTIGPRAFGEALFRVVITLFYAWGLWRVAVMASPRARGDYFPLMTLAAIPVAAGAIRSGQMNIPLAACMCLAVDGLARGRDWRASAWMALGLLTKPLGLVLMLLVAALRPSAIVAMVLLVAVSLTLPFIKPDWAYVAGQYAAGVAKVLEAGRETAPSGSGTRERFADLGGALQTLGIDVPSKVLTGLRALAAVGVLALAYLALRRGGIDVIGGWRGLPVRLGLLGRPAPMQVKGDAPDAPSAIERAGNTGEAPRPVAAAWIVVLGLSSAYLMLFNPRTEGLSYPILLPALGAMTCWALFRDRRLVLGATLGAICLVMATAHVFFKGGDTLLRPLATAALLGFLTADLLEARRASRSTQGTTA